MQGEVQNTSVLVEQNYEEKLSEEKDHRQQYKIQLSLTQAAFLMKLLPTAYSLQFQNKIQKRSSTTQITKLTRAPVIKKKSADFKLLNQVESESNRRPSNRSKKSVPLKYNDEINDIGYAKYATVYPKPQLNKRNTYDYLDESLKPCVKILNLLKNNRTSWPFREPVDPIAMQIPHYTQIVKQPMDLSKIQQNLRSGQYATATQFHADLSKIIRNSYAFNKGNMQFTHITEQFEQYYFKIIADPNIDQKVGNLTYNDAAFIQKPSALSQYPSSQNKRKKPQRQFSTQTSITLQQKKQLSINIRRLPREYMKGIVDIVKRQGESKIKDEFDLEDLRPDTIRELQNYVRSKLIDPIVQKLDKNKSNDVKQHNQQSEFQIQSEEDS